MITNANIQEANQSILQSHQRNFNHLAENLESKGLDVNQIIQQIRNLKIAIPGWALGKEVPDFSLADFVSYFWCCGYFHFSCYCRPSFQTIEHHHKFPSYSSGFFCFYSSASST